MRCNEVLRDVVRMVIGHTAQCPYQLHTPRKAQTVVHMLLMNMTEVEVEAELTSVVRSAALPRGA